MEIHVLEATVPVGMEAAGEDSEYEDSVMLEPWFTMPEPTVVGTFKAQPGQLPLPDPPIIPEGNEEDA